MLVQWNLYKAETHGTENIFHIGQISVLYKLNNTDSSGRNYRICSHWANFHLIQVPPYTSFTVFAFQMFNIQIHVHTLRISRPMSVWAQYSSLCATNSSLWHGSLRHLNIRCPCITMEMCHILPFLRLFAPNSLSEYYCLLWRSSMAQSLVWWSLYSQPHLVLLVSRCQLIHFTYLSVFVLCGRNYHVIPVSSSYTVCSSFHLGGGRTIRSVQSKTHFSLFRLQLHGFSEARTECPLHPQM
jgi:hypothetical protein